MRLMLFGYSVALALLTGLMLLGETRGQGVGGAGSTCVNVTLGPCAGNTAFADGAPDYNTSIGKNALPSSSAGNNNTAFANGALQSVTIGQNNSAFGTISLNSNTTGASNSAFGYSALFSNVSGSYNVGVGFQALQNVNANGNIGVGTLACGDVTTGTGNLCVGHNTGRGITVGSNNTIVGGLVQGLPAGISGAIIFADGAGTIRADFAFSTIGQWTFSKTAFIDTVIMKTFTFATLPACNAALQGGRASISDGAATPVFTAAAAGGGTLFTPVYCDGTTWRNG